MDDDWVDLNNQQNFNDRQKHVQIADESLTRIGKKPFAKQTWNSE